MKYRRTVQSVINSVLLIALVFLSVLLMDLPFPGKAESDKLFASLKSSSPLKIQVSSVDRTILKAITLNDVEVRLNDLDIVSVPKITLNKRLWTLVDLLRGKETFIQVGILSPSVWINDQTIGQIQEFVSTPSTGESSFKLPQNLGLRVFLEDGSVFASFNSLKTDISNISLETNVDLGFKLKDASLNIPSVQFVFGSESLIVNDVRAFSDSTQKVLLSVDSVVMKDIAQAQGLSSLFTFSDSAINVSASLESASGLFASYTGEASSITLAGGYLAKDWNLDVTVSEASVLPSSSSLPSVLLNNVEVSSSNGEGALINFDIEAGAVKANYGEIAVDLADFSSGLEANIEEKTVSGTAKILTTEASPLKQFHIERANLSSTLVFFQAGFDNGLALDISSVVSGDSDIALISSFGGEVTGSLAFDNNFKPTLAQANLDKLFCAALPGNNHISGSYDFSGAVNASFDLEYGISGSGAFTPDDGQIDARLYLTDFNPLDYEVLAEQYIKPLKTYLGEDTGFDGSIIATFDSKLGQSGRFSFNIGVRALNVANRSFNAGTTFEATLEDNNLQIDSLALSSSGFRLSYNGKVNFKTRFPEGLLLLQDSNTGSDLASMEFNLSEDGQAYDYIGRINSIEGASLEGKVDWLDLGLIRSKGILNTSLASYPLNLTYFPDIMRLLASGSGIELEAFLSEARRVELNGQIKALEVATSETSKIEFNTSINGFYDLTNSDFNFDLTDFLMVSRGEDDSFYFGFDLSVLPTSISFDSVSAFLGSDTNPIAGNIDISFPQISSLWKDFKALNVKAHFADSLEKNGVSASVIDGKYYFGIDSFDLSKFGGPAYSITLSALGETGLGFFSDVKFTDNNDANKTLILEASLEDNILKLGKAGGEFGTFALNSLDFALDWTTKTLDGTLSFENTLDNVIGPVKQGGTVTFSASLGHFSESQFDFKLGLKDCFLGDGFTIKDNEIDISIQDKKATIVGSLVNGVVDFDSWTVQIDIAPEFLFGLKAQGYVGKNFDLKITDLYFPVKLIDQFINYPSYRTVGGILTGDVHITGPFEEPSFYGMLYSDSMDYSLFWLPDQVLSTKNMAISLTDRSIQVSPTPTIGYSLNGERFFSGTFEFNTVLQGWTPQSLSLVFLVLDKPFDFWFPYLRYNLNIRSDITGRVELWYNNEKLGLDCVIHTTDAVFDFEIPNEDVPDWYRKGSGSLNLDLDITTGKNTEFFYPSRSQSIVNFTFMENENVHLKYDKYARKFGVTGNLGFKTGQIYYFQNDFFITEGNLALSETNEGGLELALDLRARIRDYDTSGNRVDIYLVLQNASLNNFTPRFESTPAKSETEILQMLGQSLIPTNAFESVASVASIAAVATEAIQRLGIIQGVGSYSLSETIKQSLGLEIFSTRSPILQNIIIDALPSNDASYGTNLLARYLDGTSVFAGKYLGEDFFAKASMSLRKTFGNQLKKTGTYFLTKDLGLDLEFSFDWDNPMGTFTVFTRPNELSIFNFFDTIGFSVTKRIQF